MARPTDIASSKRSAILAAVMPVFGHFGFKKASVDDLALAANISKQGLYLHFASKEEIFLAAMLKYLEDGLVRVGQELNAPNMPLSKRLLGAMDAWFGRHLATFSPESFDVIEAGRRLSGDTTKDYEKAFQLALAKALDESPEFKRTRNVCTSKEVAWVLFTCGLTWKDGRPTSAEFMKKMRICIRACCQIDD